MEKGLAAILQAARLPNTQLSWSDASDLGNGERLARRPLGLAILYLKEGILYPR